MLSSDISKMSDDLGLTSNFQIGRFSKLIYVPLNSYMSLIFFIGLAKFDAHSRATACPELDSG